MSQTRGDRSDSVSSSESIPFTKLTSPWEAEEKARKKKEEEEFNRATLLYSFGANNQEEKVIADEISRLELEAAKVNTQLSALHKDRQSRLDKRSFFEKLPRGMYFIQ